MRKRLTGLIIFFALVSALSISGVLAQQSRGRAAQKPATQKPSAQKSAAQADLKIKYRTTTAGQSYESVTMIKGARERSEMHTGSGMDTVNITQCDLKRMIQLSDKTKKYVITPLETGDEAAPRSNNGARTAASEPARRGGLITYVTTATDTGERKEMFGFTARHVKSTMTMDSSPDACYPVKQRMESDGWYIDLAFGLDCYGSGTQMRANPLASGGCQDRVSSRQVGTARKGYPLSETTTMYGPDGRVTFTSTKEVLELSREPIDAALLDVPAGYTETQISQELYGAPSMNAPMSEASPGRQSAETAVQNAQNVAEAKQPGAIRIGVVAISNKTDRPVSLDSLRERLVGGIESSGIDAVTLNATSFAEAEVEAKAKQCDFILFTDVNTLKTNATKKLGGFLGRAAGVSGIDKTESRIDFRLFAVGETSPRLQSTATAKEEGDEVSVGTSLDTEARMVSAEVRKKRN